MLKASEIKQGYFVKHNGNLYNVLTKELVPSPENERQFKISMSNLDTGEKLCGVFPALQEFQHINLERKEMILMRKSEKDLLFSNEDNSEQLEISSEMIGGRISFLHEKSLMDVFYYRGMAVSVELPKIVVFDIDYTEDIEKDSQNMDYLKEARLNNGLTIKVPAFVKTGDKVRIYTETGEYICRD